MPVAHQQFSGRIFTKTCQGDSRMNERAKESSRFLGLFIKSTSDMLLLGN